MKGIIKKGASGLDVLQIQQRLHECGLFGKPTGDFDEATVEGVKKFQRSHDLVDDGVVGPITWGALFRDYALAEKGRRNLVSKLAGKIAEAAIHIAAGYIGIREIGSTNRSPLIDRWLRALGVPVGNPWCMAFVQGVVAEAAVQHGVADPLKPDTASCLDLWNRVPKSWKFGPMDGKRGDIAIWKHSATTGHTGIVEYYEGGFYHTIEGNTNDDGSREGYEVCRRRRKYSDPKLLGFIRFPDAA